MIFENYLDWYKDFGITVIPSIKSGESYSTLGDFEIDTNYARGSQYDTVNPGFDVIYHKTFCFMLSEWLDKVALIRILKPFVINIEKIYLLEKLGITNLPPVVEFIKAEGAKIPRISRELFEDMACFEPDEELKKAVKGKEIYYFQRMKWTIRSNNGISKMARARFNFLIRDKLV